MKNRSIYILGVLTFCLIGCEDFEDDNLDFSNNFSQYVEFSSASPESGAPGMDVELPVRMRESLHTAVTIDYEVSGDLANSGSVTIATGDLSAPIVISIPAEIMTGSTLVKLVGVDNDLTLGRGGPDSGLSPVERQVTW